MKKLKKNIQLAMPKIALCMMLSLSLFLLSCTNQMAESAKTGVSVGDKALDFKLNDLKGNAVSLSDFLGQKPVFLICTTTWCPHCVTIIPDLKKLYAKYKSKPLEMIAVYINEPEDRVKSFAEKHELPYKVLLDIEGAVANSYQIRGVPTLMVIDKKGTIRYVGHGIPLDVIEKVISE